MTMGDLISREALIEVIRKSTYVTSMYFGKNDWREWIDRDRVFAVINGAPAVDAEPVRHGTWEMRRKTLKTDFATLTGTYPTCSLCGHTEFGVDKSTPYCPGCGAKMDGDEK